MNPIEKLGRIAIVNDGGGYNGVYIAGVLEAAYERSISPVLLAGVSVGALESAKVAESNCLSSAKDLVNIWRSVEKIGPKAVFSKSGATFRFITERPALISNNGLIKLVRQVDVKKVIASSAEVWIVVRQEAGLIDEDDAFIVVSSREERLRRRPELFLDYIQASCSIPIGFEPKIIDDKVHSDGFLLSPIIERLNRIDIDTVFIILNGRRRHSEPDQQSCFKRAFKAFRALQDRDNEKSICDFLYHRRDFEIFDYGITAEDPPLIKRLFTYSAGLQRDRGLGAKKRRLVVMAPRYLIPTLNQTEFGPGDISLALKEGHQQTTQILKKLFAEVKND